jgi:hypothetical protein
MTKKHVQKEAGDVLAAKDYIKEYFEQDNFGTAYPIYFTIRDIKWEASYHFGDGDRYLCVYDYDEFEAKETLPELLKSLRDSEYLFTFPDDFDFDSRSDWQLSELSDLNGGLLDIYSQVRREVDKGMFLLKSEAEKHLKSNSHHYSKDAYVYCHHAWRAPGLKNLLESLSKITEINYNTGG